MPRSPQSLSRFKSRVRSVAARLDTRLRRTSDRLQDWRRARIDPVMRPAAAALAPANARWRDFMASEYAPATIGRPGPAQYWTAGAFFLLLAGTVLFLAWFDWNHIRGPIGRFASERLDRQVVIQGDLDVDILRWTPQVRVEGLRVGGPEWADDEPTAEIERLDVRVRALPLLTGRIELPAIEAFHPVVVLIEDAEGRRSWDFGRGDDSGDGMDLPAIQRLLIEGGELSYANARRRLTLNATVDATETVAEGERAGFRLTGEGTLNGAPLTLEATGGPLVHVRRGEPYRFEAILSGAGTRITAEGQVTRPFDLGQVTASITARGQDLADGYYLTTVPFPNTPPYRLSGRLTRDDEVWRFEDFSGRVGDSDLSGDVVVSRPDDRRLIEATLRSNSLDLDDLLALTGAPPATGAGETASGEQEAMAAGLAAQGRLLPDAPLHVERLRSMDARVDFQARSVRRNELAVTAVSLGVDLQDGVLTLDPIAFDFRHGRLNATARIDGSRDVPYTALDARLTGYPIQTLLPVVRGSIPATGVISARARLQGPGASVHRFADGARGSLSVVMPRGEMRQAFAELLGINAGAGLRRLLSGDQSTSQVRCAVGDFRVQDGVATARTLVIDTDVVLVSGSGGVNLGTERMDLRLDGESKKPRLLTLWSPINVTGPLRNPGVGVEAAPLVAQGGLAALLGSLLSPIAAILPFVDPGLADDADCAALLAAAG